MLPRKIGPGLTQTESVRWRVVDLSSGANLPGEIIEADVETGIAKLSVRGADRVADDGTRTATFTTEVHNLGAGGIAIVRR